MKPIPKQLVTFEQLCEYEEREPKELAEIEKLGYFGANKKGLYDLQVSNAAILQYLFELKSKRGPKERISMQLPIYSSMQVCNAATGIPAADLRLAKAEGCEAFKGSKVHLKFLTPLLRYISKGMENGEVMAPRTRLDEIKANREQLKYDNEMKKMASKDEVKAGLQTGMAEVFSILERLFCSELPPRVLGLRELQVREICRAAIEECKVALRDSFKKWIEEAEPEETSESSE